MISSNSFSYDMPTTLVNVKNIKMIAQIFVAFSEKLNFNELSGFQKARFVANGKCQESLKSF
jgi:hypothetical protein